MQSVIHNWTKICRQIDAQRNQILPRIPFSSNTSSSFLHNWPCPSQQLVNCGAEQQSRKLCQAFPSRPHFLRPCPFLVISSSVVVDVESLTTNLRLWHSAAVLNRLWQLFCQSTQILPLPAMWTMIVLDRLPVSFTNIYNHRSIISNLNGS